MICGGAKIVQWRFLATAGIPESAWGEIWELKLTLLWIIPNNDYEVGNLMNCSWIKVGMCIKEDTYDAMLCMSNDDVCSGYWRICKCKVKELCQIWLGFTADNLLKVPMVIGLWICLGEWTDFRTSAYGTPGVQAASSATAGSLPAEEWSFWLGQIQRILWRCDVEVYQTCWTMVIFKYFQKRSNFNVFPSRVFLAKVIYQNFFQCDVN